MLICSLQNPYFTLTCQLTLRISTLKSFSFIYKDFSETVPDLMDPLVLVFFPFHGSSWWHIRRVCCRYSLDVVKSFAVGLTRFESYGAFRNPLKFIDGNYFSIQY